MNRIQLNRRLERLNKGFSSDESYDMCIVLSMANMPFKDYLKTYLLDVERIFDNLNVHEKVQNTSTYKEVVFMLQSYYSENPNSEETDYMLSALAKPIIDFYERRIVNEKQN